MGLSVHGLSDNHGFSQPALQAALDALRAGRGRSAQFNHPELGGMGQWMPGMIMISDMFNASLKTRVQALFSELAESLRNEPAATPAAPAAGGWYPPGLGTPAAVGEQNGTKYAYFPQTRRLAIEEHGALSIYDTADHQIFGAAQSQSGSERLLRFQSQLGEVELLQLRRV